MWFQHGCQIFQMRVIELIDEIDKQEENLESNDDKIERQHINCNFLDETRKEVVLTAISLSKQDLPFPCKRTLFYMTQSLLTLCLVNDIENIPYIFSYAR